MKWNVTLTIQKHWCPPHTGYNAFAHRNHQPTSENLVRTNMLKEQGEQLGLKYADYLVKSTNMHVNHNLGLY